MGASLYDRVEEGDAAQEPLASVPMRSHSRGRIIVVACCAVGLMAACFAGGYHVGHQSISSSDIQMKFDARTAAEELINKFDKDYSDHLEGPEIEAMYSYLGEPIPSHMKDALQDVKLSSSRLRSMQFEKSFRDAVGAKWDGSSRRFK